MCLFFQFFSDFDSVNLARVEIDTASLSGQKSEGSPTRQPTVAETIKSNVEAALDINLEKPPETDRNHRLVDLSFLIAKGHFGSSRYFCVGYAIAMLILI